MTGSECHEWCFIKARRLGSPRRVAVRDINTHVCVRTRIGLTRGSYHIEARKRNTDFVQN